MAASKIAFIVALLSALSLLSTASRPIDTDDLTVVPLDSLSSTDDIRFIDHSLRLPPSHHHHLHHHHGHHHGVHGHGDAQVVPSGDDMILAKKGDVDSTANEEDKSASEAAVEKLAAVGAEDAKEVRPAMAWAAAVEETKKIRAKAADSDLDSDSDSDDEIEKKQKKKMMRRMKKRGRKGWMHWFSKLWRF